jgi:hypothetical protein
VEWLVPQGQTHLDVKITYDERHYDACRHSGKDVHKELCHRHTLLSENCPKTLLSYAAPAVNFTPNGGAALTAFRRCFVLVCL